jgi:hypothetical protein
MWSITFAFTLMPGRRDATRWEFEYLYSVLRINEFIQRPEKAGKSLVAGASHRPHFLSIFLLGRVLNTDAHKLLRSPYPVLCIL